MPRVLLDFSALPDVADDAAAPLRATLDDPVRVIVAETVADVRPALAAVEAGVAAGLTAAGFLAYEAAPAFEPAMRVRPGARMPLLWFGLFREGAGGDPASGHGRGAGAPAADDAAPAPWRNDTPRADHAAAIAAIRERIADGITYQVNFTTRLRAPFDGDPLALWHRMRRAQGPGLHAYLDTGRFVVASVSPELFFHTRGRAITTRPMKGTRPRGARPAADAALRRDLERSAKDRSENVMIVDLLRNDLGRVAVTGSVAVPRLHDVEAYRTVWQMTSTVTATLRDDAGLADILAALFPCGSVTGAPKISTMEVIADLERAPREVYCGAIGIVRPGGDATFSVPIRTAWLDRETGQAEYGTGGGVVWDSTPDAEYDELEAKAVVVRAPWPEFRLLETMPLRDGAMPRRDRHLARLRASADRFGFPFPADAIDAALDGVRAALPAGPYRVRLLLGEAGDVAVETSPLEAWSASGDRSGQAEAPEGVPFVVAAEPVDSADLFLHHKTTHRAAWDRALAAAPPDARDVLLVNERGELTEFTRGNLVIERAGERLTPPLDAGVLPGCLRAELLEKGEVREATLRPADLDSADAVWFVNSLRGLLPAYLLAPSASRPANRSWNSG